MLKRHLAAAALSCTAAVLPSSSSAEGWIVRGGFHNVDPASDTGTIAGAEGGVESSARPTFNIGYFFTQHLALDVLASLPFKHDITLNGDKVGDTEHLPPTVSLQYHFLPSRRVDPFVAVGVNYTRFFKTDSPLGNLTLADSFGVAVQAGVDVRLQRNWFVGADVRWMDIDTDAELDGANIGTAKIDPLAYGMTLSYRF